jgi:hypothetical protein
VVVLVAGCGRGPFWYFGDDDDDVGEAVADCDRADFLFVVDDSPSMQVYQRKLVESFPVFMDGVRRVVDEGTDLRVGVVTTDAYYGNPPECEVPGALVTATTGAHSSWGTCGPFAEGARYMTEADDLEEAFACTAKVGTLGSEAEMPLQSIVAAVDPISPAAPCNDGFSRPDALLTVVIVADETDSSPGSENNYAQKLADLEGGRSNVVVVALTGEDTECDFQPYTGECVYGRVGEFANWFDYAFIGPIDGDYAEQFDQAVELVADACAGD